ncbi:MAG: response regulator [Candidatus Binatia bacterium]
MERKKTILVVDDEPDIINIVRMILEKEGYEVLSASNGLEAMAWVRKQRPDAILLDRSMPQMDGDEVMTHLKESPDTASIPVVLLTSMDKYDDVSGGYKLGADGYITKPFSHTQITNGIKLVLARRPSLSDQALEGNAVKFLRACYQLTNRARELVEKSAAQERLSPSEWLYQGLKTRLKGEPNRFGDIRSAPDWVYVFRGWGVDFSNSKTGEQVSLAIGPGGRSDTFDEWRIQCYIETEAQRGTGLTELNTLIKNHNEATERFIEYLGSQGWIERPKVQESDLHDSSIEAQLEDRWVVSGKGISCIIAMNLSDPK